MHSPPQASLESRPGLGFGLLNRASAKDKRLIHAHECAGTARRTVLQAPEGIRASPGSVLRGLVGARVGQWIVFYGRRPHVSRWGNRISRFRPLAGGSGNRFLRSQSAVEATAPMVWLSCSSGDNNHAVQNFGGTLATGGASGTGDIDGSSTGASAASAGTTSAGGSGNSIVTGGSESTGGASDAGG